MSSKEIHIHVDRLKDGEEEQIDCSLEPQFLDLKSDVELTCTTPVTVSGKVYIAGDFLIGALEVRAEFTARCAVCGEAFPFEVTLDPWRFEKPLEEIRGGVWDFTENLREELLVEIPLFPQCGGTVCSNRDRVAHFFAKEQAEEGFRPFQDLFE